MSDPKKLCPTCGRTKEDNLVCSNAFHAPPHVKVYWPVEDADPKKLEDVLGLIAGLRRGVREIGLHEDNNTELFDITDADERMAEAADFIERLLADRNAVLEEAARVAESKRHSRPDIPFLVRWNQAVSSVAEAIRALKSTPPEPSDEMVEKVARALCVEDCRDPDEEVIGGQCTGFENFGPLWQANERSENTLGGRNYVRDARAAIAALQGRGV